MHGTNFIPIMLPLFFYNILYTYLILKECIAPISFTSRKELKILIEDGEDTNQCDVWGSICYETTINDGEKLFRDNGQRFEAAFGVIVAV